MCEVGFCNGQGYGPPKSHLPSSGRVGLPDARPLSTVIPVVCSGRSREGSGMPDRALRKLLKGPPDNTLVLLLLLLLPVDLISFRPP